MIDYKNEAAEVRARINLLLKEKGITQNLDTVLRILAVCPDVSGDWLLRGTGEKYKTTQTITGAGNVAGENATVIGQQNVLPENFVRDMLAEKDKQIQTLLQIMAK